MIVNMFVKVVAVCYVSYAIVDDYDGSRNPTESMDLDCDREASCDKSKDELCDGTAMLPNGDASPGNATLSPIKFPPESLFPQKKAYFWTP